MILGVLFGMLCISFLLLLRLFYIQNTIDVPVQGGTYIEGSVGEILPLNPWFITTNDVNRDIVSLIFGGLMKYDPTTGKVIDDLATVKASSDNRVYTATLKPNIEWHDSVKQKPHFVTADDVFYTFTTIQHPDFPNPILKQNFRGVTIEKLDERTVRFKLENPYSFFTSNLTLGLVPKSAFEGIPVKKLNQALDFGFHPIGAGPYSFVNLMQTDLSTEVTLKRFDRPDMPTFNIDRLVFRVFPEYSTLLTDITNINGVRLVPRNEKGQPIVPRHFQSIPYTLPQYVGLFFNLDRPIPAEAGVRLGLSLAINKQGIVDAIHETRIIDTPLLEIDTGDWHYRFDSTAAKGAFFNSSWNIPEKIRLQRLLEQREANRVGPLSTVPRIALLGSGAILTITGSTKNLTMPVFLNGIRVQTGTRVVDGMTNTGTWIARLPAGNGQSGSLKIGMNSIRLTNTTGDIIDSAFLERFTASTSFARAAEEQRLVEQFLVAKKLPVQSPQYLGVEDLYLERNFLRRKTDKEIPHTRINASGQKLSLVLLTSKKPSNYALVASSIQKQWQEVGVEVTIDIPESEMEFQKKLLERKYDVLLFGQALFDNLDSYPYWHSSQIQERGNDPKKMKLDASNLSQFTSFNADVLLSKIRETSDMSVRKKALAELNEQLKKDIPAVVLYSPLYVHAHDDSVQGITLGSIALHADRFASVENWYVSTKRQFLPEKGWFSFVGWLFALIQKD